MRVGRRADNRKTRSLWGRLRRFTEWHYAAFDFFTAFVGGLGVVLFDVFALSLAANSCLTFVVMAFTSTL